MLALSPLDGRYQTTGQILGPYFSEWGLFRYRVRVEWLYFEALCDAQLPGGPRLDHAILQKLRHRFLQVEPQDVQAIKTLEATTLHDIKAMEYWMKSIMDQEGAGHLKEWIHFALTSQDINHTAIPLSLHEALQDVILPNWKTCIQELEQLAHSWIEIPMLARTHGQAASPTRLGKEIMVWVERLQRQYSMLEQCPIGAKFGGATGNFNAHHLVWPQVDWHQFANHFVEKTLGLTRYRYTTQIEHYDYLAALCHNLMRMNTILLDACRDLWQYISMGYFKQQILAGQVGSSAMPHKVNPIDFENAEGNVGMANSILAHLADKLPVSRLQRDLSDSTVLRNLGVPLGHGLLALQSFRKGLSKIQVDQTRIQEDLDQHWSVLAEGIQTVLRQRGIETPYEKLKELTRTGASLDPSILRQWILDLQLDPETSNLLLQLRPDTYTGLLPDHDGQAFPS
ncbi:MAG: adenylosuccinate lyase [Bacteroidetes bacterium]|nr:adenylosuccinate lyase [Bacteroidota bacterium]NBY29775.1 adenylosuccinate lyase [Sphingobacteriia bacterium]